MEIPKSILKQNEKNHACKSTKSERRRKLYKFADACTKTMGRGRFNLSGTYCCFECIHHLTGEEIQGKPLCVVCNNGKYFVKKGE
jgi:hypothetical protein